MIDVSGQREEGRGGGRGVKNPLIATFSNAFKPCNKIIIKMHPK